MIRRVLAVVFAVVLAPLLLLGACAGASCACIPTLNVYAAASLGPALEEIEKQFPAGVVGHLRVGTGSSTALRVQLEQGLPTESAVFLSADTANADALVQAGLTDGPALAFAANRLTIIVPRGNPAGISSAADLGRDGVRVIGSLEGVPITTYAEQVLGRLSGSAGYPEDFAAAYEANVVSREESVGAVVARIALGEGDVAIVYATDARAADVESIAIPDEANVTATYAAVVLRTEKSHTDAHAFLEWLRGPHGQSVLGNSGFLPAP